MEETEWLAVEFEDVEYVVDVQSRCFSQLLAPTENAPFHSGEGKAMAGTEWRAWTPRVDDREGVV
jgi:hypothetical protein